MEPLVNSKTLARTISYIEEHRYSVSSIAEACKQLKIPIDKLVPRPASLFESPIPEITMVRQEHYETKRKKYMRKVAEYLICHKQSELREASHNKSITAVVQEATPRITKEDRLAKELKVKENLLMIKKKEDQKIKNTKVRLSKEIHINKELPEKKKQKNQERDEKIRRIREDKLREIRLRETSEIRKAQTPQKARDTPAKPIGFHSYVRTE